MASLAVERHRSHSARQQETRPPPQRARPLSLEARVLPPPLNPAVCSPPRLQPASRARLAAAASSVADRRLPRREALVACLEMLRLLLPQPAGKPARACSAAAPGVRRVVRVSLGSLLPRRPLRPQVASLAAPRRLPAVRVARKLVLLLPRPRAPLPPRCLEEHPRHLRVRRLPPNPRSAV